MKDNRWDIPATQQYNFKNDLQFGKKGEQITKDFLEAISTGSFEVKTDRYRNGRMVVETQQNPRDTGWKPSGVEVTLADWWVYVYALDGSLMVIKVERLKRYIQTLSNKRLKMFAPMSNNPTKGFLLLPEEVMNMMTNPIYDAPGAEQ
jgi:hypothetical protein